MRPIFSDFCAKRFFYFFIHKFIRNILFRIAEKVQLYFFHSSESFIHMKNSHAKFTSIHHDWSMVINDGQSIFFTNLLLFSFYWRTFFCAVHLRWNGKHGLINKCLHNDWQKQLFVWICVPLHENLPINRIVKQQATIIHVQFISIDCIMFY